MNKRLCETLFGWIMQERKNQEKKWGEQHHTLEYWLAILVEEIGEVAKAICENDIVHIREELIQSAAVIFAMLEDKVGIMLKKEAGSK